MNRDRISNLTKTKKGEECIKIRNRRKWITFLTKHTIQNIKISNSEKRKMIKWVENTSIDYMYVSKMIDDMSWKKSNQLNY
jgi:hypothetical protein